MKPRVYSGKAILRTLHQGKVDDGLDTEANAKVKKARQFFYDRLMQVTIRHTYYADTHCPDFNIVPTYDSAVIMQDLGMLFKPERFGFSILYDTTRVPQLLRYVEREAQTGAASSPPEPSPPEDPAYWSRLSFMLALKNPYFINFTNLDVDLNPLEQNLYFANTEAHLVDGEPLLNPGRYVSAGSLLPIRPSQFSVWVGSDTEGVERVELRDLSGTPVLCKPRCYPRRVLKTRTPNSVTCQDAGTMYRPCACQETSPPEDCVCAELLYFDMALLPEGRYTQSIIFCDKDSEEAQETNFLYSSPSPPPLCFIDLLFARPTADSPGLFPLDFFTASPPTSPSEALPSPQHYFLDFETRSTYWNYFVVPQPERALRLSITDKETSTCEASGVAFLGPCCVRLNNGAKAYRFTSDASLALHQFSPYCFQLDALDALGVADRTLIQRMPVASMKQVQPQDPAQVCGAVLDTLCDEASDPAPFRAGQADVRCQELIQTLCNSPPEDRIYSDIYVYI